MGSVAGRKNLLFLQVHTLLPNRCHSAITLCLQHKDIKFGGFSLVTDKSSCNLVIYCGMVLSLLKGSAEGAKY